MSDAQWRDERLMLDRILALIDEGNRSEFDRARVRTREMPHATLAEMADATFALYEDAIAEIRTRPIFEPLSRARIRDSLGYRRWAPPPITAPAIPPSAPDANLVQRPGVAVRVAQVALALRHTIVGRTLYRVTPRPVLDALKARLKT
jgi:hypothetical protein